MKKAALFLMVLLLAACGGHPQVTALLSAADSLLAVKPDSALRLLDIPEAERSGWSRSERMRYQLLQADAQNKCYVDFTTDSLLLQVCDYYDHHGTALDRLRAHYLLGCTYRDLGEAPQALQCYQDAVELADTTNNDHLRLLMKVYGQMADLYHAQNLPTDELRVSAALVNYSLLLGDTLEYILNLEQLTKPYYLMGDTDKVISTIKKSHDLFMQHGLRNMAVDANATLAYICIQRGQLEETRRLLLEYENLSGLFDGEGNIVKGREIYYYIKGVYFLECGQLDSAEHYMRRNLANVHRLDGCRGLLDIYRQKGNLDSVSKYAHLYEQAVDSMNNLKRTDVIHQMTTMYNYHRFQRQADQSEAKAWKWRMWATLLAIVVVCGIMAFILIWKRHQARERQRRKKMEAARAQLQRNLESEIEKYDLLKRNDELLIHEKELEIMALKAQAHDKADIERLQEKYDQLQEETGRQLQQKAREIADLTAQLNVFSRSVFATKQIDNMADIHNSSIVKKLRNTTQWRLGTSLPTDNDWSELESLFKQSLQNTYAILSESSRKVTPHELQICMLLLLNFSENEVASLLDVSPQSLSRSKRAINKKLFNDNSATSLIDNILRFSVVSQSVG